MLLLPKSGPTKFRRVADFFNLLPSIFVFSATSVLNPIVRFAPAPDADCPSVQLSQTKQSSPSRTAAGIFSS